MGMLPQFYIFFLKYISYILKENKNPNVLHDKDHNTQQILLILSWHC